jgi:very-short-patch-repair endonuclease
MLVSESKESAKKKRKDDQEEATFKKAKIASAESDFGLAVQLYSELISSNPKSIYYNNRAFCRNSSKDLSGAIKDYSYAINKDKTDDLYYFNRGITLWNNNINEMALLDLSKAADLGNDEALETLQKTTLSYYDFRKLLQSTNLHIQLGIESDKLGIDNEVFWESKENTSYPIINIPIQLKELLKTKIYNKSQVIDGFLTDFKDKSMVQVHIDILQYLTETNLSFYKEENPKVGISENFFYSFLKRTFGNQIKTNCKFGYYYPDFIFKHSLTNLRIDIEIDEPYGISSKEMYHGASKLKENKRKNYFLSNQWVVLRFAEEQVLLNPIKCCNLISAVVYLITYDSKKLAISQVNNSLRPVKRWKNNDDQLILQRYRESYIKKWKNLYR